MQKILIVDDNEGTRLLFRVILEKQGYAVIEASRGSEALNLFGKEDPDGVLLDLKLPDMDGIEVLKELKKSDEHLPVVMVTAHGDIPTAVEAIKIGAHDFITKPHIERLEEILKSAIDASAGKRVKKTAIAGHELRKADRYVFRRNILVNGAVMLKAINISETGLYVHSGRHFVKGSVVDIEIPMKGSFLRLKAHVQFSQEGVGMGLRFANVLPAQEAALKALINSIKRGTEEFASVLFITDDAKDLRIHTSRLVQEGYSVLTARDEKKALELIGTTHVDVIFFHLLNEFIDIEKVLASLKNCPECGKIPIFVLSDKDMPTLRKKAANYGAAFISRISTSPVKMLEIIKSAIKETP